MANTYYRMQANSRGIDSWLVTWEARPKKPDVFRTTHFLDEARVYTEQEILESSYPLHDGEHWVLVECSAAESVTVRVVEPGWWLRHMGPMHAEPSKDQRDARDRLGELDPGVKVKAWRLSTSLPNFLGKPVEWVATSEPPIVQGCGGSTEAEALESFRRVAVGRVATSVANGEIELTEAEWAMFRRLLARIADLELAEQRAGGTALEQALEASFRALPAPSTAELDPENEGMVVLRDANGGETMRLSVEAFRFLRNRPRPHGEGCLCPEPCPYTQTPGWIPKDSP